MRSSGMAVLFLTWTGLLLLLVGLQDVGFCVGGEQEEGVASGEVVELTDATFEAAIAKYDHIFVDFYAPWCHHCKRLSPELDKAALILADESLPIVLAKIDAEKYRGVASKFEIDGYPTLKVFINGFPIDYEGPRLANALVSQLRRLKAQEFEVFPTEAAFREFVKSIGTELPLFVGFGLEASVLKELARRYRNKAWFAVLGEFSEKAMVDFDFDKGPALVALRGEYETQEVFYGPFEDSDLADFVKQNLLALVTPLTFDSLKLLQDDGRPNVVAVLESFTTPEGKAFIKKMKAAAPANRAFVFTHVVASEWPEFVRPFNLGKPPKLPTVVVWDGNFYSVSANPDAFVGDSVESELSRLLRDFKENRVKRHKLRPPSLYERATQNVGTTLSYLGILVVIIWTVWKNRDQRSSQDNGRTEGRSNDGRGPDGSYAAEAAVSQSNGNQDTEGRSKYPEDKKQA